MKKSLESGSRLTGANWKSLISTATVLMAMTGNLFAAATFVSGLVPDWNQPYRYPAPNGPGPDPAPFVPSQWNDWCAPCSGANLAGHLTDARGIPVADNTAFPGSDVLWAAGPSWQDYLADGTVNRPLFPAGVLPAQTTDIGWYMNANYNIAYDAGGGKWMGGYPLGNPQHRGTYLKDIHAGLQLFLNSRYSLSGGVFWKTGTRGSSFAAGTDPTGAPAVVHLNLASAFGEVMSEIGSNRTLIVCFTHWNLNPAPVPPLQPSGTNSESTNGGTYYTWGSTPSQPYTNAEDEVWTNLENGLALGHAVTVVGYIRANDPDDPGPTLPGLMVPTDWVIVHDNWSSTPRNVIVPYGYLNPQPNGTNWVAAWVANTTAKPWLTGTRFVKGLVPDWNQPYDYSPLALPPGPNGGPTYPNINNPPPFGAVDQWSDWCGPSSAANLTGHWKDHHNVPVADNTAFPGSDVMWGVDPSWQDYLADGTVNRPPVQANAPASPTDIGWYLDCNLGCPYDAGGGAMGGYNFGNANHPGTYVKDLHAGLKIYLDSRYDNSGLGWVTGTAGQGIAWGNDESGNPAQPFHGNQAAAFGQVMQEICHDRTLLLSFKHWVVNPAAVNGLTQLGTNSEPDIGGFFYTWDIYTGGTNEAHEYWNLQTNGLALGHIVTAVGFIPAGDVLDPSPSLLLPPTDWVIVHDNWPSTTRNVIVPFDFANNWVANTIAYPAIPPLRITNITLLDFSHLRIGFNGIPGCFHDLVGTSTLQTTNAWSVDMSNIVFSPGTIWVTNTIPPEAAQRFYRIRANY